MKTRTSHTSKKNKKALDRIYLICWRIIPLAVIILLVLDGIGLYPFNTERLLVIGCCILVMLIPFFSEITIKNISIKKNTPNE